MQKIFKRMIVGLIIFGITAGAAFSCEHCTACSVDQIIKKLSEQKEKVKNYEADIVTEFSGALVPEKVVQRAHIVAQGSEKARTDIYAPLHQVTIKNKDKVTLLDSLGNVKASQEQSAVADALKDPQALLNEVDFAVEEKESTIILTGVPKGKTLAGGKVPVQISKIVFTIDKATHVVSAIDVFDLSGNTFVAITIEYEEINELIFPNKSTSLVTLSQEMGGMSVVTGYSNIKLNQEIDESIFDVETVRKALMAEGSVN